MRFSRSVFFWHHSFSDVGDVLSISPAVMYQLGLLCSLWMLVSIVIALWRWHQKYHDYHQLDVYQKDFIDRTFVWQHLPEHMLYTLMMINLSLAYGFSAWSFLLMLAYFSLVKYTEAFGLLSYDNKHLGRWLRYAGSILVMWPLVMLSVAIFLLSLKHIIEESLI